MTTFRDLEWLQCLTAWLSPAYPVGAFNYSHGLEWAVETGDVRDRASLEAYVATALEQGAGQTDLMLAAAAWRAASRRDASSLRDVVAFGRALRGSCELALEARQQGAAFASATRAAWPGTPLDRFDADVLAGAPYAAVFGVACAGIPDLEPCLTCFAQAFAANLVSAGLRLVPLGQTDGQKAIASLAATARDAARRAMATPFEAIGSAAPAIDIASMRHETQYTRLFRS